MINERQLDLRRLNPLKTLCVRCASTWMNGIIHYRCRISLVVYFLPKIKDLRHVIMFGTQIAYIKLIDVWFTMNMQCVIASFFALFCSSCTVCVCKVAANATAAGWLREIITAGNELQRFMSDFVISIREFTKYLCSQKKTSLGKNHLDHISRLFFTFFTCK